MNCVIIRKQITTVRTMTSLTVTKIVNIVLGITGHKIVVVIILLQITMKSKTLTVIVCMTRIHNQL